MPALPVSVSIELMVNLMEQFYSALLEQGWKPEDARQFLPIGTSSQIVVTANFREWRTIFKLRCSPRAHWEIRTVIKKLLRESIKRWPLVFGDLDHLVR